MEPILNMRSFQILWDDIPEDSYLRKLSAIRDLEKMEFRKNITLFCGENGTGKSTVLRGIAEAWGLNPHGGTKNYLVDENAVSDLGRHLQLCKGDVACFCCFVRADHFLQTTREMEEFWSEAGMPMSYGERFVDHVSHGESFRAFLQTFRPGGLYFLDEPDGAFSVRNLLAFMSRIIELAEDGSQFIIVTHSPILLGLPDAEIYNFSEDGVYLCDYENTDAYCLAKSFLNEREKNIHYLRGK